jgi:hypothetical protein
LTAEQERRLKAVAARIGSSKSAIIRLLIDTFLDQCVRPDGSVILPPNWKDLLPPADLRSGGCGPARPSPSLMRLNEATEQAAPAIPARSGSISYKAALARDRKTKGKRG